MRLAELFRNSKKEHDQDKTMAYHEAGHGLVQVSFGLLPQYTSLIGFRNTVAFNSTAFYAYWDTGIDWGKEGRKYALMLSLGGIVGGAFYSGIYDWSASRSDIEKAGFTRREYGLSFQEYLGIWFDTHDLVKEYGDLLERAAEQLYQDKVLGAEFWEKEILLARR